MFLSVALCTYNGESFLEQQLISILDQTLQVNEIVVCDDCSNDNTLEILKTYEKKFPNLIKLYANEIALGTIKNFEKAISLTTGDLIFLADQDDIWHKNKVEMMSRFFQENNNCKLLFTDGLLIDGHGTSLNATLWEKWCFDTNIRHSWRNNQNAFKDLVINHNKITGATVCFHSSLKANVLPIAIPYGYWHDVWLGLHAAAQQGLMFLEQPLISYRIHDKQQIGVSIEIDKEIRIKSNKNAVTKGLFYKKLVEVYPHQKTNIPNFKEQSLLNKAAKKIRRLYLSLFKAR
jgi:glycosyltransferase involved in cell wall biosynthesis